MNYNYKQEQQQRNGFDRQGNLLTAIKFSAAIMVCDIREKHTIGRSESDEPTKYWIVKDDNGVGFSVWDKTIVESLTPTLRYQVEGCVKVAKGGTYLNITKILNAKALPVKYASEEWKDNLIARMTAIGFEAEVIGELLTSWEDENWTECKVWEREVTMLELNAELDEEGILPY